MLLIVIIFRLNGGIHWESGKPGPLGIRNKHGHQSTSAIPVFHTNTNPKKLIPVRFIREKDEPGKMPFIQCGQCEKSSATMVLTASCFISRE